MTRALPVSARTQPQPIPMVESMAVAIPAKGFPLRLLMVLVLIYSRR